MFDLKPTLLEFHESENKNISTLLKICYTVKTVHQNLQSDFKKDPIG